jgi:hypothetical protein
MASARPRVDPAVATHPSASDGAHTAQIVTFPDRRGSVSTSSASCPELRPRPAAARFSCRSATRVRPTRVTTSSPWCSSQAIASWAAVTPQAPASGPSRSTERSSPPSSGNCPERYIATAWSPRTRFCAGIGASCAEAGPIRTGPRCSGRCAASTRRRCRSPIGSPVIHQGHRASRAPHEVGVQRRTNLRPRTDWADRAVFAALVQRLHRRPPTARPSRHCSSSQTLGRRRAR